MICATCLMRPETVHQRCHQVPCVLIRAVSPSELTCHLWSAERVYMPCWVPVFICRPSNIYWPSHASLHVLHASQQTSMNPRYIEYPCIVHRTHESGLNTCSCTAWVLRTLQDTSPAVSSSAIYWLCRLFASVESKDRLEGFQPCRPDIIINDVKTVKNLLASVLSILQILQKWRKSNKEAILWYQRQISE